MPSVLVRGPAVCRTCCSFPSGDWNHRQYSFLGTNLIHDFTAVTFRKIGRLPWNWPISVNFREICDFNAFTFIYEGFHSFINSFCADFAVSWVIILISDKCYMHEVVGMCYLLTHHTTLTRSTCFLNLQQIAARHLWSHVRVLLILSK